MTEKIIVHSARPDPCNTVLSGKEMLPMLFP